MVRTVMETANPTLRALLVVVGSEFRKIKLANLIGKTERKLQFEIERTVQILSTFMKKQGGFHKSLNLFEHKTIRNLLQVNMQ